MKLIICDNELEASKEAYNIIEQEIKENNSPVLGLATGSTPIKLYELMIEEYKKGNISFKNVKTYNLDEYVGLDGTHPASYRYFMNNILFNHIDINIENTFVPIGTEDAEKNAEEYDQTLEKIGVADIQILGIGSNGHIAFNEPSTDFNLTTHIENLTENTIKDNARFFDSYNDVPTQAITMGIASIMKSKKIILMAFGSNKANAIKELFSGIVTQKNPASILNEHSDVTIICDKEASSLI